MAVAAAKASCNALSAITELCHISLYLIIVVLLDINEVIVFREGANCLLNQEEEAPDAVIGKNFIAIPGLEFSPHNQCRFIYGSRSFYCGVKTILSLLLENGDDFA